MIATGTSDPFEALFESANFYYDMAMSGSHAVLPSLLTFAKPGRFVGPTPLNEVQ